MQLFCLFPRRKVAYEVKVISLHQGFVGNLFGFPVIYQEKIWGEWVQTRGYLALRILHADTHTRLLSGSAHEAQTFLDNLWKPKKSAPPPCIDNNFPSMVKLLYLCMTDSLGGGWLS